MARTGWMHSYPRVSKPNQLHNEIAQSIRDIRDSAVLGNIAHGNGGNGGTGIQKALEDYTVKVVQDKLEGKNTTVDPLRAKLAEKADMLGDVAVMRALAGSESTTPAPNSTQDVISAAQAITSMHRDLTSTALDDRDRAQAEKEALEENIGHTIQSVRQEEQAKAQTITEILSQSFANQMAMVQEFAKIQITSTQAQADQQIAAIRAENQQVLGKIEQMTSSALSAKDQQLALIQEQNASHLALIEESHKHELALKDMEKQQAISQAQTGQSIPPWEAEYRTGMAQILVNKEAVKAVDEHNKSLSDQGLKDSLGDLAKNAMPALVQIAQALGGMAGPPSPAPRNGIPGARPNVPQGQLSPNQSLPQGQPQSQPQPQPNLGQELADALRPNLMANPPGANPLAKPPTPARPANAASQAPDNLTTEEFFEQAREKARQRSHA